MDKKIVLDKDAFLERHARLPWQKLEMHVHTSEDVLDGPDIAYSIEEFLEEAHRRGYGMVGWTDHLVMPKKSVLEKARKFAISKGILLIPGVEFEIKGRHILLYFDFGIDHNTIIKSIRSFDDIRALKEKGIIRLVGAPHPFYPFSSIKSRLMQEHIDIFDFIELNWFYSRPGHILPETIFDRNAKAISFAAQNHLPILACGDLHRLDEFSKEHSLIRCEKNLDKFYSFFNDIKKLDLPQDERALVLGYRSRPLSLSRYSLYTLRLFFGLGIYHLRRMSKKSK